MLEGLNTAAAGMAAQQQRIDAVANDLANASTTGYKHQRVGFRDLVYDQTGRSSAQGVRTGSGAAAVDAGRSFGQGVLQRTDRSLDVAIQGEGFLRIKLPDGREALTRNGGLHVDGAGNLTTSTGALVQPAIKVPTGVAEDEISIGPDSTVLAAVRNGSADDRQAYKTALGFEQLMLGQLVDDMLPDDTLPQGPYAAPM